MKLYGWVGKREYIHVCLSHTHPHLPPMLPPWTPHTLPPLILSLLLHSPSSHTLPPLTLSLPSHSPSPHTLPPLILSLLSHSPSSHSLPPPIALIAEQFLESTATQLTYYGLCELNMVVQEGELCVFFRNNHFCTLFKRKVCVLCVCVSLSLLPFL